MMQQEMIQKSWITHTHTQKAVCFGRISTGPKQGGIKIIYKTSSCKDVTSSSCRCSCPKSPGKQLAFWYTSFCWKSVAAHWINCKENPHYILFSLPSCTPFCPVATSPESDWPSGRGWNLATLTNSLPWLKPLKNIIVYQNLPKSMVIWPFILFVGFNHFLLVVHRKLPSGLFKIRLQMVCSTINMKL